MRITGVETFVVHAPVGADGIRDSTHRISHWGVPGVKVFGEGAVGWGFTGTHAHLPSDRAIADLVEYCYAPLVVGQEVEPGETTWSRLYHHPELMWVGRTGMTSLALAALDIALWDLKAKVEGVPLWALLGGQRTKRVQAYDTDGGWLSLSDDELVGEAERKVAAGFRGVKVKVGSDEPGRDVHRVALVRRVVGPDVAVMVDANGRWDLATAVRIAHRLAEHDVRWLEEPLWFTDVSGHARLAASVPVPIALGEQLYTTDEFEAFFAAEAVHFAQPDAVRLAGVTEWLRVATLAHARHLPVVPHVGDMMPVHAHLSFAHPAVSELEYIPWLQPCLVHPVTVTDGWFVAPDAPGAGTELNERAMSEYRRA